MQVAATTGEEHRRSYASRLVMVAIYLAAIAVVGTVVAQKPDDPKLKPRMVKLKTKDGIELRAFYFPSAEGKEAVTALIVHEWEGQASPYQKLVLALRDSGCAVLIPDYRGHGGSREYIGPRGTVEQFNLAQMSRRDVENIIAFDLEKAKAFLKDENNEGNLNLNALVVIGIREGCVLAAHWAKRDWSFPSVGRLKQGQDVKGLVLISPEKQVKGIGIDQAINNPALLRLPVMIAAGGSSPEASEARRLGKRIEGIKKRLGRGEATGFEMELFDTTLSGPSLVNDYGAVIPSIVEFIKTNVDGAGEENPYIERD